VQRNVLGISIVVVAVCIAWVSWAWSPDAETERAAPAQSEPDEGAQALAAPSTPPPPLAALKVAPQIKPEPAAAAPQQPAEQPERIPTPHPMSLDQTRPPEAYGPLAEYKQRYASESRAAESSATEQKFRSLFDVPNIPPGLLQDVSCRRSMCKLALAWRPERRLGFVVTLESSKNLYNKRVAVEPGTREDDGSYLTNLYIRLTP
jgi:hypothetical protein